MTMRPILGAALGLALAGAAHADEPRSVGAANLYVPQGYDDNDEIVVMVDGYLPSTCYQLANPKVTTDPSTRIVTVDLKAHVNTGTCFNVPVPFQQEVDLGSLPAGEWRVQTTVSSHSTSLAVVAASSSAPDEHLYAPVDSVTVTFDKNEGRYSAELTGDILATCLSFSETRVLDQGSVLVVLPILEQTSSECQPTSEHFSHKILLPNSLSPGHHLLHIRSLNGRGVNLLFDVRA